jgi:hypothetical protein
LASKKNERITLDRKFIEALYLEEVIDEYDEVGWAEINAIMSAMIGVKAAMEWTTAYDWNMNLNVFQTAWMMDDEQWWWDRINMMNKNDLPFNNNFLNTRPGKMAKSKASFITAIEGLQASYEAILESDIYPQEVKDAYPTLNAGINLLLSSIQNGGKFWVPEDPTTGNYPTSASSRSDILFGVDMGKFFQEGYFSLDNVFETDGGKPVFYLDGVKLTTTNYLNELRDAENYIALAFRTKTINDIVFDIPELYEEVPELNSGSDVWLVEMFPPELAKVLFEKYYK